MNYFLEFTSTAKEDIIKLKSKPSLEKHYKAVKKALIYLEGNPVSGVPSCDGCHEENGYGSPRYPRVAGQNQEYTLEQFRLYATGHRKFGKKVMRTVAERITEQEAKAVAEYIASMP